MASFGNNQLALALLLMIERQPAHGYLLKEQIKQEFDVLQIHAIYRELKSLTRAGLVTSSVRQSSRGPAPKVCALTEEGRRQIPLRIEEQRHLAATFEHLISRRKASSLATPIA